MTIVDRITVLLHRYRHTKSIIILYHSYWAIAAVIHEQ